MIIKSTTRKQASFRQLLTYVLNQQKSHIGFTLTHNLRGKTIDEWVKEFEQNESYRKSRRANSVILSHEILSWHKYDENLLSIDMVKEMTYQYIQHRNPNGLYVAVAHIDKGKHWHVHLVVSGVEYRSGVSMRMSKQVFSTLKQQMETHQRTHYPKLAFSQVNHGNQLPYAKEPEYQAQKRTRKRSSKEELILSLEKTYQNASSLPHFLQALSAQGIDPYYRNGQLVGVWYGKVNKRKYRLGRLGFGIDRLKLFYKEKQLGIGKGT